jgi:hypothetical protein
MTDGVPDPYHWVNSIEAADPTDAIPTVRMIVAATLIISMLGVNSYC